MSLAAALIYWLIVLIWLIVLGTIIVFYVRNPRVFGTTRLLLAVVAIDTLRNIAENVYFGLYFGGQYGLFPSSVPDLLGIPSLLIVPKLLNVGAGCVVLILLLLRWLPAAVREREESDQEADDLKSLTSIDGLTGLYNRRQFELLARTEWARFESYLRPLSLLIVDADQFGAVIDRFGHEAGDRVLECIAVACTTARRDADIVARIGVQEFALLLPDTNEAGARIVAQHLRDLVRDCSPTVGAETTNLTVSIGIAGANPSMHGVKAFMKRADAALVHAKRAGRDRAVTASEKTDKKLALALE